MKKPIVVSGIKPTGILHIGNYLGMLKNAVALQESNKYECFYFVADYHALTQRYDPKEKAKEIFDIAVDILAAGIDPKKSTIFLQSHIPEHANLAWIFNTITSMGMLERMVEYKEKLSEGHVPNVGLFDYPVLMAADILLYKTAAVPVGEDQVQHIELARDLAQRFNNKFGEIFVVPKPMVRQEGARIMGLDDPTKKMSKSAASQDNYISLIDSPDAIREKIKKAVTDSGKEIMSGPDKPALANLLMIYSLLVDKSVVEVEQQYRGKGYAEFKKDLAEVIVRFLEPFQKKYNALDEGEVLKALRDGAKQIQPIAAQTISEVKKAMGIIE